MADPLSRRDPLKVLGRLVNDVRLLKLAQFGEGSGAAPPPWAIWSNGGGFQGGAPGASLGGGYYRPRYFPDYGFRVGGPLEQSGGFALANFITDGPADYNTALKLPDGVAVWVAETWFEIMLRVSPGDITVVGGGDPYWLELGLIADGGLSVPSWAEWLGDWERIVLPHTSLPSEPGVFRWHGHYTQMWKGTGVGPAEPNIISWAPSQLKLYDQGWTPLTATWNVGAWESFYGAPAGSFVTVVHQV